LPTERAGPAVPPEETFLQRLLEKGATESSNGEESSNGSAVEAGLTSRKAATMKTMKCLLQAIDVQRAKNDEIAASLRNIVSPHGKFPFGVWDGWLAVFFVFFVDLIVHMVFVNFTQCIVFAQWLLLGPIGTCCGYLFGYKTLNMTIRMDENVHIRKNIFSSVCGWSRVWKVKQKQDEFWRK
jgi:hypothetical protein